MKDIKEEITVFFMILYILLSAIGFTSVYLNLYLFVQVRYYTQWSMSKFFSTWLYNFFVHIYNMDDYGTENDFRNAYDNRVRY
uniref:Golgi apparatus membrane protein TVP23 homolog n=1 Tax=Caenorhabditis tropicalis TaxID=1561998 RepID=A0A1I7V095_9PELO